MIQFEIQDNLTEYFDELEKHFNSHKDNLSYSFSRKVVGAYGNPNTPIARHMSTKFNPYLFMSGQDEHYWDFTDNGEIATMEVLYSGKHLHDKYPVGKAKVWWEFATKSTRNKPATDRVLEKDYAEFQETGDDSAANYPVDPNDAKHKYAIDKGLSTINQKHLKDVGTDLMTLMELRMLMNPPFIGFKR